MAGRPPRESPAKTQITIDGFDSVDMRVARVIEAREADGTRFPSRVIKLDLGHLGERTSVGQFHLVPETDLVGRNVIACINLGERKMGSYVSQALVLGAPHPKSPPDQAQATPLFVSESATPGDQIF